MSSLDPSKGFMPYPNSPIPSAATGPLHGLTFAVKDLFDVAGYPTSAGQPTWLAQSGIKNETAPTVTRLLQAGAAFCGKTITDELAFSLIGSNAHFGSPINPAAPDRFSGGSSSGSATAVAHGLVDFSLGTDTGGSVRTPASNCGIFGFRPSHGRVSLSGAHALAPSFDTCGWFARNLDTIADVGAILLDANHLALSEDLHLMRPTDLWNLTTQALIPAFEPAQRSIYEAFGELTPCTIDYDSHAALLDCFRTIQGYEAWQIHGAWIKDFSPQLGPGVKERFEWASTVRTTDHEKALRFRENFKLFMSNLLGKNGILILPTLPDIAPLRTASPDDLEDYRRKSFYMLSIAGLACLPQLSMPITSHEGAPIGLSLIGPRGSDQALISFAKKILRNIPIQTKLT